MLFVAFEGIIFHHASLLAWRLRRPRQSMQSDNTNRCHKKGIPNIGYTQFTWFPATEWLQQGVSEKISIGGNNVIHSTVIRDSVRWKEKICSLTRVTHRETQILSKCHQAHCSYRASCENAHSEFIIFIYFHLGAIITLSKGCDSQKKRNWKAKLKVTAEESVWIIIFFPPLKQEMLCGTNGV